MVYHTCLSAAVGKTVWHTPLLCVQWKTSDDGQRNCPKHVEFYSKNKFEKLVHLVWFIIRNKKNIYLSCRELNRNRPVRTMVHWMVQAAFFVPEWKFGWNYSNITHTSECTFHNAACFLFMLNIAICNSFIAIHSRLYTTVLYVVSLWNDGSKFTN